MFVFESDFTDCRTSIYAEELENIKIWNTLIENTSTDDYGIGVHLTQVDNCYLEAARISNSDNGILIYGATDFVMSGGNIYDSRLGINLIDAPSANRTNSTIDLIGGATLENNFTGIFGLREGITSISNEFPMITLDCARLIENIIGVRGRDLVMNMDGGSITAPNVLIDNPNFSKSRILELCYDELDINTIEATNNYWGANNSISRMIINEGNSSLPFCYNMTDIQDYSDLASNNGGPGNVTLDFAPVLTAEPTDCGGPNDPTTTGGNDGKIYTPLNPTTDFHNKVDDCEYSQEQLVFDTYNNAYGLYLSEAEQTSADHTASRTEFDKIAILTNQQISNYSHTCKMLVRKAQSRTGYAAYSSNLTQGINGNINTTVSPELVVFPNPAQNSFTLNLSENETYLKIFNRFGQEIFQQKGSYQMEINTEKWQSGVYFIEILDTQTNERQHGKVMINR